MGVSRELRRGQKVKLRDKSSLGNEYGLRTDGCIKKGFIPQMMPLCGRRGTVVSKIGSAVELKFMGVKSMYAFMEDTLDDIEEDESG